MKSIVVAVGLTALSAFGQTNTIENVMYVVKLRPSGRTSEKVDIPASAFRDIAPVPISAPPPHRAAKLHPRLPAYLAKHSDSEIVDVLLNFRSDIKVPRLPHFNRGDADDSPANQAVAAARQALIDGVKRQRAARTAERLKVIGKLYDLTIVDTSWLADIWHVRMPAGKVRTIAQEPDLISIEPALEPGPPPPYLPVSTGRGRLASDWLYALPTFFDTSWLYVGLLDTGVDKPHIQLEQRTGDAMSPNLPPGSFSGCGNRYNRPPIGIWADCVHTTTGCLTVTVPTGGIDPGDSANHGTASAAIITANSLQPVGANGYGHDDYHGVSKSTVDSYKVYNQLGLDYDAVRRAFDLSIQAGDEIILAEMQDTGGEDGTISTEAEAAFDAGSIVIAPVGNTLQINAVGAPAAARKVLGIGSIDALSGTQDTQQVQGPTADGRIKPDVQMPTNVETAQSSSVQLCYNAETQSYGRVCLQNYGGTSAAGAFGAAAAGALFRFFCDSCYQKTTTLPCGKEPGMLYAAMITHGAVSYPFNNTSGAGPVTLPNGYGDLANGSVSMNYWQSADVSYNLSNSTYADLTTAIWWPETAAGGHSYYKIDLIDPQGVIRASSSDSNSVFQKVKFTGPVTGIWTMRITPVSMVGYDGSVYFGAFTRCTSC